MNEQTKQRMNFSNNNTFWKTNKLDIVPGRVRQSQSRHPSEDTQSLYSFKIFQTSPNDSNIESPIYNDLLDSNGIEVNILDEKFNENDKEAGKSDKFSSLLSLNILHMEELRNLSFPGIPQQVRPEAWRLLTGYLPPSKERRRHVLDKMRTEYWMLVNLYSDKDRDKDSQKVYRQIHVDILRMGSLLSLFKQKIVQEMFERILFTWSIRHPSTGYVQGMNDLVIPFFVVFLQEYTTKFVNLEHFYIDILSQEERDKVEADCFWCFSNFMNGIQDNYIAFQIGVQQKVNQIRDLVHRIDPDLHKHLQLNQVDYIQFSFRWINNLLMRELPLKCSLRLWDTYLAELHDLPTFQIYICVAFLLHWRQILLQEKQFDGLMYMLQKVPTSNWGDQDVGILVAEAYKLKFAFAEAPNHFHCSKN